MLLCRWAALYFL